MAVDHRLNHIMTATDPRLTGVPLDDVELQPRVRAALSRLGATNLGDAYWTLVTGALQQQPTIGPHSITSVRYAVKRALAASNPFRDQPRLDANNLLLAFESLVLDAFELEATPESPERDERLSAVRRKLNAVRHRIMNEMCRPLEETLP